jgi:hypothetical protein
MEAYNVNAIKTLFSKMPSTKVDQHEASRDDLMWIQKKTHLIMQQCLDEVPTRTISRPSNNSNIKSFNLKRLARKH